jgi:hypothetical protein
MDSFGFFDARLLKQCISSRRISQLRTEKYERVQSEGESLATYVQSIRDAALVFRISENETQVVEQIVEGLLRYVPACESVPYGRFGGWWLCRV